MDANAIYRRLIDCRRWRSLRRATLAAHPLCVMCQQAGRVRVAEHVHHIRPIETGHSPAEMERLAYSPSNLQPLCRECHTAVHRAMGMGVETMREQRRQRLEGLVSKWLEPPAPAQSTDSQTDTNKNKTTDEPNAEPNP